MLSIILQDTVTDINPTKKCCGITPSSIYFSNDHFFYNAMKSEKTKTIQPFNRFLI